MLINKQPTRSECVPIARTGNNKIYKVSPCPKEAIGKSSPCAYDRILSFSPTHVQRQRPRKNTHQGLSGTVLLYWGPTRPFPSLPFALLRF